MLMTHYYIIASLALSALPSIALEPTAPGPGEVFRAGSFCTLDWKTDTMARWTSVKIDLMSGSNDNMTIVKTVVAGLDGTDPSLRPFNWTCPDVDPYSAIYFYQFDDDSEYNDPQWTTRFTISSTTGESVPPQHSTQPNGDVIAWGFGHLRSVSKKHIDVFRHAHAHQPPIAGDDLYQESEDSQDVTNPSSTRAHYTGKSRLPFQSSTVAASATLSLPPQFASAQESDVVSDMMNAVNGATEIHGWPMLTSLLLLAFGAL